MRQAGPGARSGPRVIHLLAPTVGNALFRGAVVDRLRRLAPHVDRASALSLLGAGLYLSVYWVWLSDAVR